MLTTQEQIELSNGSFHGVPVEKIEKARSDAEFELQKAEELLESIKNSAVVQEKYGITIYDLGNGRYAHVDNTRVNSPKGIKLQNVTLSTSMHSQLDSENADPIKYEIALEDGKIKTVHYSFFQESPSRNIGKLDFPYNPNGPAVINFQDSGLPEKVYYTDLCSIKSIYDPDEPKIIGSVPGKKIFYAVADRLNEGIDEKESDLTSTYHFDKDGEPQDIETSNLKVRENYMIEHPYKENELAPINEKIENARVFFASKFSRLSDKEARPMSPEEEIATLRNKQNIMKKVHQAEIADLTKKLSQENDRNSELNEELTKTKQENVNIGEALRDSRDKLIKEENKNASLTNQNASLTNQNASLTNQNKKLNQDITTLAEATAEIIETSKSSVPFYGQSKLGKSLSKVIRELPQNLQELVCSGLEKISINRAK